MKHCAFTNGYMLLINIMTVETAHDQSMREGNILSVNEGESDEDFEIDADVSGYHSVL